jgi:DNA-binding beta-propeller fold protein YncE
MRNLLTALLGMALFVVGCSSSPEVVPPDEQPVIERGPKTIAVDGDPNGIWWDAESATLYMADDENNRVLRYRDGEGISLVANLPEAPANGPGLGDIVRLADGTLVVPRFGYGTAGDIVYVRPDGTSAVVPNLPRERRRLGITVTQDGQLLSGYFVRNNNVNVGSVARLSLEGTEQEIVGALVKPVGILAVGDSLYISDQLAGKIYRSPLANPSQLVTLATLSNPDLLTMGPNNLLLTGSREGNVLSIRQDGQINVIAGGFQQPRGLAYDAKNKRLFIADHDGNSADGTNHTLRIIPLE